MGNHEPSIFSTTAGWWWLHTGRVASQSMSLIQTDNHVYSVHSKFACIALKCKQEPVTMQSQFPPRMPFWFFSQFSQQDKDFVFVNCPSEALICLMLALGFGWPSEHQSATNDNTNVYRSPNKPFLKYIYIYIFRWQKQVDCLHMISKMAPSVWREKNRKPALRRCPLWRPLVTRKQLHDQNWNLKALTSDHRLACSDFLTQSSA